MNFIKFWSLGGALDKGFYGNSSLISVHERLFNEKYIIDERRKRLQQKYVKVEK